MTKPPNIVLPEGSGVYYDIPASEYHGSKFINRSKLDDFHESPEQFHNDYILGKKEDEEKKCYLIGRALHALSLEGQAAFDAGFVVTPTDAPKKPNSKQLEAKKPSPDSVAAIAYWQQFAEFANGRSVLTQDDYFTTLAMAAKLRANKDVAMLLSAGQPEVTMRMKTPRFGYSVQCRADWLNLEGCTLTNGEPYMFDLKTMAGFNQRTWKREWKKAMRNFGYHRAAAFYTGISSQLLNVNRMIFGLVSKTPPCSIVLTEIDEIHVRIAQTEILADLKHLNECIVTDTWSDALPEGIQIVEPDNWELREAFGND